MREFFNSCACRGARPHHLQSLAHISRPALTSRMLRERSVVRCIVAPVGYGKTGLAFDYANTVFNLEHTFWIDASNPCFLRDLDKMKLKSSLDVVDSEPYLAIFEDVPHLDAQRSEVFCKEITSLLDAGNEVLITCEPSCDTFERLHDRIVLRSTDLLLDDSELATLACVDEGDGTCLGSLDDAAPASRVALIAWGSEASRNKFLERIAQEDLSSQVRLALFLMSTMGEGNLRDFQHFFNCNEFDVKQLAQTYPNFGIDLRRKGFSATSFSMREVAKAFLPYADSLAQASHFSDFNQLVGRVGDALVTREKTERACELMTHFASADICVSWLEAHAFDFINTLSLCAPAQLYERLNGAGVDLSTSVQLDQALRLALLGPQRKAVLLVEELSHSLKSSSIERFRASVAQLFLCDEEHTSTVLDYAQRASQAAHREKRINAHVGKVEAPGRLSVEELDFALRFITEYSHEATRAIELLFASEQEGISSALRLPLSLYALRNNASLGEDLDAFAQQALVWMKDQHASKSRRLGSSQAQYCVGALASVMSQLSEISLQPEDELFIQDFGSAFDSALSRQREAWRKMHCEEYELKKAELIAVKAHKESNLPAIIPAPKPPQKPAKKVGQSLQKLTVNLMGGMDVYIGTQRIDESKFGRKKAKTLLALLVFNRGHEISRERLARSLWPESNPLDARRNFYAVWSCLRRALSFSDGTCPYLIRYQDGVQLDKKLLKTDVDDFDSVCRSLMFERTTYGGWARVYEQVHNRFSEDLMPGEKDCLAIVGQRNFCRDRLVDALVSAACRLSKAGNAQESLWFARAALERDQTREDAYTALMRAQLASNQRTAALSTYFACRKYLAGELGIDPSPETMSLYRSIIDAETVF